MHCWSGRLCKSACGDGLAPMLEGGKGLIASAMVREGLIEFEWCSEGLALFVRVS